MNQRIVELGFDDANTKYSILLDADKGTAELVILKSEPDGNHGQESRSHENESDGRAIVSEV